MSEVKVYGGGQASWKGSMALGGTFMSILLSVSYLLLLVLVPDPDFWFFFLILAIYLLTASLVGFLLLKEKKIKKGTVLIYKKELKWEELRRPPLRSMETDLRYLWERMLGNLSGWNLLMFLTICLFFAAAIGGWVTFHEPPVSAEARIMLFMIFLVLALLHYWILRGHKIGWDKGIVFFIPSLVDEVSVEKMHDGDLSVNLYVKGNRISQGEFHIAGRDLLIVKKKDNPHSDDLPLPCRFLAFWGYQMIVPKDKTIKVTGRVSALVEDWAFFYC